LLLSISSWRKNPAYWTFSTLLLAAMLILISPSARADLRVADSVSENFTPSRTLNFACGNNSDPLPDFNRVSDGDIANNAGYCPNGSTPQNYTITLTFDNPNPNQFFDMLRFWANAGGIYSDNELRFLDIEIDYVDITDPTNTLTLIMDDVDIGNTLAPTSPLDVLFTDTAGNPIFLPGVSEVRLTDLRNNLNNNGEIPVREVQINFRSIEFEVSKTSQVFNASGSDIFSIPGNDVIYNIEVQNVEESRPDDDSVFVIDALPANISFFNGDIDDGGPLSNPVAFIDNGSNLTFNFATDVRFSKSAAPPSNFDDCTDTPSAGYDPTIRFICFNPKGSFATGTPTPSFTLQFRAQIQ